MNNKFNGWYNVNEYKLDKVIDLVITNSTVDTVNPDTHLFHLLGNSNDSLKVLDFGCGVCRNTGYLSMKYPNWNVYGYDNENMLKHAADFCLQKYKLNVEEQSNLKLTSDWDLIKTQQFDVIFALLVFQHIYEKDIKQYLQDISKITKKLIVFGRRFNDDMINEKYKNTWQIFENSGLYPSNANEVSYNTHGDLEEHTLCIYDF